MFYIDWYIKAFGSSVISIFPIMFTVMSQSYLNDYVKELAYSKEKISSSQLENLILEYDKIVESVSIFNYYLRVYNGLRILMILW